MAQGSTKNPVIITTPAGLAGVTDSASKNVSIYSTVTGYGNLRVSGEPSSLFYDTFDAALDTAVRWTSATSGTGASNAVTTGNLVTGCGTANSGFATVVSQITFPAMVPSFLQCSWALNIPDGASPGTTSWRFWGLGSAPGSPAASSASAFMTDGVGWEIDTTGAFNAVIYAGGVRTIIAVLTSKLDASNHRFICQSRTDRTFWYIDSIDIPVAIANFVAPQVQGLPIRLQSVSTSGGTTNKTIVVTGIALTDTSGSNHQISDAIYPWRKLTVTADGAQKSVSYTATAPTLTNVASSATNVTLLSSNANRRMATIFNDSTQVLYVKFGATASTTSYTVQVSPSGFFEFPYPTYTGQIDGIWASANGNARITEIT